MITEQEQFALDIDWFFTNGYSVAFVASAGGRLPQSVSKSKENLELLSCYFRNLPQISDVKVNKKLRETIPGRVIDERYLEDYTYVSKRGLYSFDKTPVVPDVP
jgi:hypothetical protein